MCEHCIEHGEGKKWYLNVKNYSDELWADINRRKIAKDHFKLIARIPKVEFKMYKFFSKNVPFLGIIALNLFKKSFNRKHLGQVVPIEDVEQILNIVNSIVRIPCICRKSSANKNVRYCFAISINPESIGMAQYIDQNFSTGPTVSSFETMNKVETLKFMKGLETHSIFHTVWTVGTPFIAFICNCGTDGCIPMLSHAEITPIIVKSEYIANINDNLCDRCNACIRTCVFKAIKTDVDSKICIDKAACYGCGICRVSCRNNAIKLIEKDVY